MSYDIWVEMDAGGEEPMTAGDWNYTSNMAPAWRAAGADLGEFHGLKARVCSPVLRLAIARMEEDTESYREYDAQNGWGSMDTLLPALRELADDLERYPEATVKVSR